MMFGGSSSGGGGSASQQQQGGSYGDQGAQGGSYSQPQDQAQPCEGEMGQFVQCSLNSSEITDCLGYLDMLKQCRDKAMSQHYY